MRKFLVLITTAVLSFPGISFARYGNPALAATDAQRNAEYEWMYNVDSVAHEVGDVVVYVDAAHDGLDIGETTSAANKLVAGVIAQQDCPALSWCTVQVAGYHPAVTIAVSNSAGDGLGTSTTAEGSTVNNTAGPAQFAVALEATTSSTTVKAILLGR